MCVCTCPAPHASPGVGSKQLNLKTSFHFTGHLGTDGGHKGGRRGQSRGTTETSSAFFQEARPSEDNSKEELCTQ